LRKNKGENEEIDHIYKEVLEWIKKNDAQFKRNCKELYDKENLERIKRFANAPIDYIEERIKLNKEVLKSYHKLHHSILLAGLTGLFTILISQSVIEFFKTFQIRYLVFLAFLGICLFISMKVHLSFLILRWSGLLRVIRDSEIEIYYLSKIKEYRNSIKCPKCNEIIPKDSIFCNHCGNKLK